MDSKQETSSRFSALTYCGLAALIMAYGWGYRGTVGHEAGAMIPGALVGLALAVASGRKDWRRRSVVVGLFSAIGFAWGGSLSYMEQTFYVSSDSFIDVFYGFSVLFFLGGMWAGIGGAGIGLALTEPRSVLESVIRPFTAICAVFLLVYLCFFFNPESQEAIETFTVHHFHDGDWLPATLTLAIAGLYALLRPKDRAGAMLFFWGAVAWWVGYGLLTKLGGLRLGPLHRSESWGGVLGILIAVLIFLYRRNNRAALMMAFYGILSGGFGFVLAVLIRHPIMVGWGPFADWPGMPVWRIAEVSFGFFMGLGLSLGALRLLRNGIESPVEDTPRTPLDVYAAFAVLVALIWVNFRRHIVRLIDAIPGGETAKTLGLPLWCWYLVLGCLMTAPILYALQRYYRGKREWIPQSAYGKGAMVTLLLLWTTQLGFGLTLRPSSQYLVGVLVLIAPATIATLLLLRSSETAPPNAVGSGSEIQASDPVWRIGGKGAIVAALVPVFLATVTTLATGMQEEPYGVSRKRFGPDAYWRRTARMVGTWEAVGLASSLNGVDLKSDNLPIDRMSFTQFRDVTVETSGGERVSDAHRWFLKDQYTWLDWNSKREDSTAKAEVPLHFQGESLYISWPPTTGGKGYLVLERSEEE